MNPATSTPAATASTPSSVALTELAPGEKARIAGYTPGSSTPQGRLFEMGLTPGAEIEIVRYAPLGDPIDLKIRGYHLSLRKREAAGIRVTRIP